MTLLTAVACYLCMCVCNYFEWVEHGEVRA